MIMAAADLLARNPDPSEEEVRHGLEGNLCRCTGYHNIVKAVHERPPPATRRGPRAVAGHEREAAEAMIEGVGA